MIGIARFRAERASFLGDPWPAILVTVTVLASAVVLLLIGATIWLSLTDGLPGDPHLRWTLDNFAVAFRDPGIAAMLGNTLGFCVVTLGVALFFGLPAAWLIERTDFPGKTVMLTLMTIGQLIPGFVSAMGWLFLLHPRIGLINLWLKRSFGLANAPFDIQGVLGMGWVQGLNLAPLVFVMTAAVFRAMDPALEEAAHVSGASAWKTLWRVTLPLAWPGILVASIYVFIIGFGAFDVPAVIGLVNRIYSFSTYVYVLLNAVTGADQLPRYGLAAALSTIVIALAAALSLWYAAMQRHAHRYAVVTGKAYRARLITLGRWRYVAWGAVALFLLFSEIAPLALLIYASLLPFFQLPSAQTLSLLSLSNYRSLPWELVLRGFGNTGILMVLTPTITLAISLAFSWTILRSRLPGRRSFDFISFLPHAVPHIVFGISAVLVSLFILQRMVPIYGTLWLILVVFVVARLSYGTRMTNSGLIQIHRELEEAAHVSGAGTGGVLRSVIFPLLAASLSYAWLWIALLTFRELTLAVLVTTSDNTTLPVVVWSIWQGGSLGRAAAAAVVTMAGIAPIIALYWIVARRQRMVAL